MVGDSSKRLRRRRHEEAAAWLLRNRDDRLGLPDDKLSFQAWLDRDPENRRAYELAEQTMGDAHSAIKSDPTLRDFDPKAASSGSKPIVILLLAAGLANSSFFMLDGPMRLQADVISGIGEMPVVSLPDGSTAQLNSSSAVAYHYEAGRRTVQLLRGQAYFTVAPDSRRPFVVEAGRGSITALGTEFDVQLRSGATDVVVTEHAVSIEAADSPSSRTRLGEGEAARYDDRGDVKILGPVDPMVATAWRRGQLVVDEAPLSFVVSELNRHFSGRIVILGDTLAHRRVSGTLAVTDIHATLDFIRHALGVTVTRLGPLIVLRSAT